MFGSPESAIWASFLLIFSRRVGPVLRVCDLNLANLHLCLSFFISAVDVFGSYGDLVIDALLV